MRHIIMTNPEGVRHLSHDDELEVNLAPDRRFVAVRLNPNLSYTIHTQDYKITLDEMAMVSIFEHSIEKHEIPDVIHSGRALATRSFKLMMPEFEGFIRSKVKIKAFECFRCTSRLINMTITTVGEHPSRLNARVCMNKYCGESLLGTHAIKEIPDLGLIEDDQ